MPSATSGPQAGVAPARERCGVAIADSRPLDWNNAEGKQRIALISAVCARLQPHVLCEWLMGMCSTKTAMGDTTVHISVRQH